MLCSLVQLFRALQRPQQPRVWPPPHWPPQGQMIASFTGEGYREIEPTPALRQLLASCFAGAFWQKAALAYAFGAFKGYRAVAQTAVFPPDPYDWFGALLLTWDGIDIAILIPWAPSYVPEREAMLIASGDLSSEQVDAFTAALLERLRETNNSPEAIAARQATWMPKKGTVRPPAS